MKRLKHLRKHQRKKLQVIVDCILEKLSYCEMIILYGSRVYHQPGIPQDVDIDNYDILVVTSNIADRDAGRILDHIYDKCLSVFENRITIEFINDDIAKVNEDLCNGRYFYTQIKKSGVLLYNKGNYKLAYCRKLDYQTIALQAQKYFDEKYRNALEFLTLTRESSKRKNYKMSSFLLHQTCENFYYTIRLVFTLWNNKQHNLAKLSSSTRKYSHELFELFASETCEGIRLFKILKAAYVEGRYNPDFIVSKTDIEDLIPKAEMLRDITLKICKERIDWYHHQVIENEKLTMENRLTRLNERADKLNDVNQILNGCKSHGKQNIKQMARLP